MAARTATVLVAWAVWTMAAQADTDVDAAGAFYSDSKLTALIAAFNAGYQTPASSPSFLGGLAGDGESGKGVETAARLSYTRRDITFKSPGDLLQKQLEQSSKIQEHNLGLSIDQGLGVGRQAGAFAGISTSPLSTARFAGLRAGQWWRRETLQTSVELRRTELKQVPVEYTDTDGDRVRTPADLAGTNATLTVLHLTTPTTILRGAFSHTARSDRPAAESISGELRQFINAAAAAVHVALTHYENVGSIATTQSYGSVVADSAKLEWHQHLPARLLLMGGYRYYLEREKPRAADAYRRQIGSDSVYSSLRWRYTARAATEDSNELYVFGASYRNNAATTGYLLGLGHRWVF